ncbi:redoxin domain-containing protein [Halogeometricum borinquense]|uniref:Redoxin domain-containing protein n=1 Tax=Halogeometricum borinquense TaxID=60847 RepID=A0A6C0UFG7_9EURY|nr:redoxin domain-containing protein [Halogeometricum borinquense]QIB73011.1 redoxin domain-containing protein [Halogeometricum borinquense]QIQ77593.1 redoxin domain-containing protein [Halogeometricum borinquense]
MLQLGQQAPAFSLPGAAGDDMDEHTLSEYVERGWSVILVFYPFDFHPACISQWCTLRDADWLTLLDDTVVLGIGGDSVYAHQEFARTYNIEFPLLSDSDGRVAEAYGVRESDFEGHRNVPGMALFVIDPDRTIQFAWRGDAADAEPDFDDVRKAANCHGDECELPDDGAESADV